MAGKKRLVRVCVFVFSSGAPKHGLVEKGGHKETGHSRGCPIFSPVLRHTHVNWLVYPTLGPWATCQKSAQNEATGPCEIEHASFTCMLLGGKDILMQNRLHS